MEQKETLSHARQDEHPGAAVGHRRLGVGRPELLELW